jgi:SPP1 gp7 family putative phage head morphogenesis protein
MLDIQPALRALQDRYLREWNEEGSVRFYTEALHSVLTTWLPSANMAAYLLGASRVIKNAGLVAKPLSSDAIVQFMTTRFKIAPDTITEIKARFSRDAVDVLRGATNHVNEKLRVAVSEAIEENLAVKETAKRLQQALASAGVGPASPHLIETLARTQLNSAYSAGRWQMLQDPIVNELLWGFEYATVGDTRVRDSHAPMDTVRRAKNDPIWHQWWPPNGFNCRCTTLEIFLDDEELTTPTNPTEAIEPDEGFAFNPGEVGAYGKVTNAKA